MPSGWLMAERNELVAGEASEPFAVVILHQLGALGQQVGNLRDLQRHDDGDDAEHGARKHDHQHLQPEGRRSVP